VSKQETSRPEKYKPCDSQQNERPAETEEQDVSHTMARHTLTRVIGGFDGSHLSLKQIVHDILPR
jgi:hypothetical protein